MAKPTILAVDDDQQVLRAVSRDLRSRYGEDYRILRAGAGAEALDVVQELHGRNEPIALLLSDQRMPGMSGVAFLEAARGYTPATKRVLLTAYADTEAAIAAINDSHVHYYLLKPWDPPSEKLYPVLDDLLAEWRAAYRPGYEGVRVIGNRWSPDVHRLKDFLARNHVPYTFQDVETDDEARALARDQGGDEMPLVIFPNGACAVKPTATEVAERVGLKTEAESPFYDFAIVGGGPAGLASAVYGASEGLRTVMIEGEAPGGQAGTSSNIENYLGFPAGISGTDLARRAATQARKFGVEILTPQEATALRVDGPYKHLSLSTGDDVSCHALMIATGVAWRKLPAPGADAFEGRGVYYGAAMTEALNCQDETVYIVGAGNSAGQAAMYFSGYANRVVVLVRNGTLEASMSQYLVDQIHSEPRIEVRLDTEVAACHGDDHLHRLTLEGPDGAYDEDASYLFIFIGAVPHTDWLEGVVARDEHGFILTGPDLSDEHLVDWPLERAPFLLEASVPGIFAAGDVRHASVKRVASAVGEGSVAVHFVHRHLAAL